MDSVAKEDSLSLSLDADDVQRWKTDVQDPASRDSVAATNGLHESDTPETLLRRLSLINTRSEGSVPHTGPDILHPGNKVSGRVISVVFCIPHTVQHSKNGQWVGLDLLGLQRSLTACRLCSHDGEHPLSSTRYRICRRHQAAGNTQ